MREKVITAIRELVGAEIALEVSIPDQDTFGHYSTNIAFKLAKVRGEAPMAIAESLAEELSKNETFSRVEPKAPGFVNFWISQDEYIKELKVVLEKNGEYGKGNIGSGKKIQVEYVSANPTGPLTLANGRGGFYGDVLSNVLASQGYSIEREYYVNDTGNQVRTLGMSLLANCGVIPFEENFYKGEYVAEWAEENKDFILENKENPEVIGAKAAEYFLYLIKNALEDKAHIHFDRYTSEQKDVHNAKYVERVLEVLRNAGKVYEEEGAIWFKTTDFGDDKDRVLITSKGSPTYLLADAGHYLETKERGFFGKVLILGPDHYGYVARIQAAAKMVGLEDSRVIITQAVRLLKEGEEMKMSKRKGAFVTFGELVDEVGADVARFFFLMISLDSHMDFDVALAKERSNKNPVFYLQYAFVRASSILEKTKETKADLSLLTSKEDEVLMRKLAEFPEVLEDVGKSYAVHQLTQYAGELAKAFHNFYEKEHIAGEEEAIAGARRMLVLGAHTVFKNLLDVLGVQKPSSM